MRIPIESLGANAVLTGLITLCLLIPDTLGLQCYNCRGITNYDPSACFAPEYGKTIRQECQKGETCEKRIHRIDRLQEVIERGCTSNCNDRTYIWTDDFRVYCCEGENLCNHSNPLHNSHLAISTVLASIVSVRIFVYL